jgi:hypothetical protein
MGYPDLNYSLKSASRERQTAAAAQMDAYTRAMYEAQMSAQFNHYRPPQEALPANHWSVVLGLPPTASKVEINKAYRAKAKLAHADTGGNDIAMTRLNVARDQALKERGGK